MPCVGAWLPNLVTHAYCRKFGAYKSYFVSTGTPTKHLLGRPPCDEHDGTAASVSSQLASQDRPLDPRCSHHTDLVAPPRRRNPLCSCPTTNSPTPWRSRRRCCHHPTQQDVGPRPGIVRRAVVRLTAGHKVPHSLIQTKRRSVRPWWRTPLGKTNNIFSNVLVLRGLLVEWSMRKFLQDTLIYRY